MIDFLKDWSSEITFFLTVLMVLCFILIALKPRYEYAIEIDYKNRIIEREFGRNFESYEDYLLYRIELGK